MARDFTKVAPAVWTSRKFSALPTSEAKLYYLYVLTGPHQTNAGVSKVPSAYAAYDLKIDPYEIQNSLEACLSAGLLDHDSETDEIFVLNWFKFNVPMNAKHRKGVAHNIERVESERLFELAMHELEQVYYDPEASRPNTPPQLAPDIIDRETGEIIDFAGMKSKPPHQTTRAEMDAIIAERKAAR